MDGGVLGFADDAAAMGLRAKGVNSKPPAAPIRPAVKAGASKIKGNFTALANQGDGGVAKAFRSIGHAPA